MGGIESYAGIGSRDTPLDVMEQMRLLAKEMNTLGLSLRSGGARGADTAFEIGASGVGEIFLPWEGFNKKWSDDKFYFYMRGDIQKTAELIAAHYHPKWEELSSSGRQFHTRNVFQVLGKDLQTPSKFVICWTKDGKESGGTGQAMRIARHKGIPIFNLKNNSSQEILEKIKNDLA